MFNIFEYLDIRTDHLCVVFMSQVQWTYFGKSLVLLGIMKAPYFIYIITNKAFVDLRSSSNIKSKNKIDIEKPKFSLKKALCFFFLLFNSCISHRLNVPLFHSFKVVTATRQAPLFVCWNCTARGWYALMRPRYRVYCLSWIQDRPRISRPLSHWQDSTGKQVSKFSMKWYV